MCDDMLTLLPATHALLEVAQIIPLMIDDMGKNRSLCLEIPTDPTNPHPVQPDVRADNTMVDVWRCDNFPPLGVTVTDGRDKWIFTGDEGDFEIQSGNSGFNQSAPKCLTFAGYLPGTTQSASVRVRDCAAARASNSTLWHYDTTRTQLVSTVSGLCLQVNVNKHNAALKHASSGCADTDDVTRTFGGGGCVDLQECRSASAIGDNRTRWEDMFACMATWGQCGGGGMLQTTCCSPNDECIPTKSSLYPDYMQCTPSGNSTVKTKQVMQLIPMMVDAEGHSRGLCLEIPASPSQPDDDKDGDLVDVWSCSAFPPSLSALVRDGRDKWVVAFGGDGMGELSPVEESTSKNVHFELQSTVSLLHAGAPKCLSFDYYLPNRTDAASVKVADCATMRARLGGYTLYRRVGDQIVNAYTGLCLQVHVDKHGLSNASSGCKDTGDVTGVSGGGGCIDLVDCTTAAKIGDNRTLWLQQPACMATSGPCADGGLIETSCCDPDDACVSVGNWTKQCKPKHQNRQHPNTPASDSVSS
mgnify:CR=1 FL=1